MKTQWIVAQTCIWGRTSFCHYFQAHPLNFCHLKSQRLSTALPDEQVCWLLFFALSRSSGSKDNDQAFRSIVCYLQVRRLLWEPRTRYQSLRHLPLSISSVLHLNLAAPLDFSTLGLSGYLVNSLHLLYRCYYSLMEFGLWAGFHRFHCSGGWVPPWHHPFAIGFRVTRLVPYCAFFYHC